MVHLPLGLLFFTGFTFGGRNFAAFNRRCSKTLFFIASTPEKTASQHMGERWPTCWLAHNRHSTAGADQLGD